MAELPQVVPGEPVQSTTFGNPVIDRVISRYVDASARDFAVPLPQAGDPAYLTSTDELQIYDGSEWVTYGTLAAVNLKVAKAGDTMTGRLLIEASVAAVDQGQLEVDGLGSVPRAIFRRDATPAWWRLAENNTGPFVIQLSLDDGATWDTVIQLNPDSRVEFPEPTLSTAPTGDVDNPAYGFAGGGGLLAGAGGSLVGVVGPNGEWASYCTNFQFVVTGDGATQLAIADAFTVPKVYSETTTATPNVNVNSGGAIRRSTTVAATQADLEALEAQVATLQAVVDAL